MAEKFPLQENLKKLKPNPAKLFSIIGIVLLGLTSGIKDGLFRLLENVEVQIGVGFIAIFMAVFLAEIFFKEIFYNQYGIGIARKFGGEEQWYSFDELLEGSIRQKRIKKGLSGSIKLRFHSGTVKLIIGLYDKNSISELVGFVESRIPQDVNAIFKQNSDKFETKKQEKSLAEKLIEMRDEFGQKNS
jgi:hypothetical protein